MENKNFINQSLWAGSSPNQTGETQSRENRIGVFSYFYRTFVLLFMLLTIGVGQMWADDPNPWICSNTAGGDKGTKTVGDKLNNGTEWKYDFAVNGGWNDGWVKAYVGTSSSHYKEVSASWTANWDNNSPNKSVSADIGNVQFDVSGKWYAVGAYNPNGGSKIVYTTTFQYWTNNTTLSFGTNNEPYWTVLPPAVNSFSVERSGYLAGSGTEGDPYLVASGSNLTLTASGSQAHTDANSSINYKFGDDDYSTTATKNITVTSSGSIAVKACCKNTSAALDGAETETITIYYVPVKDITVYIYVEGCTDAQINSLVLTANPYVGSKAVPAVDIPAASFTTDGDWRKYTFTNVSEVRNVVVACQDGRAVNNITITDDIYYTYYGNNLGGKCIARTTPTWNVAPADGTAGGSMTATINNVPDGATVEWSSSNENIAIVNSSGLISYKAPGRTTISARIHKEADGDYCELNYPLSQDISVTSGATVTATRACPEYVSNHPGQVKLDISSTGASTGWYYRVCNSAKPPYYAPDWQSAASNTLSWIMEGALPPGSNTLVVELYNSDRHLVCTSNPVTVNVEIAEFVTISAGANGSVSPSGTVYANNNHVHPTITATPNEHYHFVNWTSNNAAASVADAKSATTTVTATASGQTITANFAGDQYRIAYKDQGNVNYTGNNEGSLRATHTYGTATELVNGTKAGYAFNGWFTTPGCDGEVVTSLGETAYTNDVTLYAKWGKNPSLTGLELSTSVVTTGNTFTATPTIDAGDGRTTNVCWAVKNNSDEEVSTTITPIGGNAVTIMAPAAPGNYKVVATLREGKGCEGTVLNSLQQPFTVEGHYSVTITNGTGSENVGEETTATVTANPAAEGKKFDHWEVTGTITKYTSGDANSRVITFNASSDITLTAFYTERDSKTVYFAKPSGWTDGLKVYAWEEATKDGKGNSSNKNAVWPGVECTSTKTEKGTTYYSYTYYTDDNGEGDDKTAQNRWDKIIFNDDGNNSEKTADLTLVGGHFYHIADGSGGNGRDIATVSGSEYAEDWYVCGYWDQSTDDWGFAHPVDLNEAKSGSVVVPVTASLTQEFKIFRASTNEWFKWTGGPNEDYGANYPALIGNPMTLRIYNENRNTFTSYATEYRFTLDITNPSNPVLTLTPNDNTPYSATLSKNGHGSLSVGTGDITLRKYIPTTITATPEPGYRFKQWTVSGVGCSSTTSATATFTATAAGGTITAEFTNEGIIYLDKSAISSKWSGTPYVYFYSDAYWNDDSGAGSKTSYSEGVPGTCISAPNAMTRIGESQIWYYDYSALLSAGKSKQYIAFVDNRNQANDHNWFDACSVIYRGDFYPGASMFVVRDYTVYKNKHNNVQTAYYNEGYWRKYNDTDPGYVLKIYNGTGVGSTQIGYAKFASEEPGNNTCTAKIHLSSDPKGFKVEGCDTTTINGVSYSGTWYSNSGKMTSANCSNWEFTTGVFDNCGITPTAEGDYIFTLSLADGRLYVSVEYPLANNDYRIVYNGKVKTTGDATHHPSNFIRNTSNGGIGKDTVSFFVTGDWSLTLQKCTNASANPVQWANACDAEHTLTASDLDLSGKTGVYVFEIEQNSSGSCSGVTIRKLGEYKGNYYIRTDVADGGWEAYETVPDNKMIFSEYARDHSGFDYYHCHWTPTNTNVKFTIANDYSACITDTVENDTYVTEYGKLPYQASVRFMYNSATNSIGRAYLNGSSEEGVNTFLWLEGAAANGSEPKIFKGNGSALTNDTIKMQDKNNWIYQIDIKANEQARVKLISNYRFKDTDHLQYFKGTDGDWSEATTSEIIGGKYSSHPNERHALRIIYDFKTNHLLSAWLVPESGSVPEAAINTNVMIIKQNQEDARQIIFPSGNDALTEVDTVYTAVLLTKAFLTGDVASEYAKQFYWVSFPYTVKINDIFGSVGTYGYDWILQRYNGKKRAANGFWIDSEPNWEFMDRSETLNPYEGYILTLDLGEFTSGSLKWNNNVTYLSLYFPSDSTVGNIKQKNVTVEYDQTGYACTITRDNRNIKDSYWHCIGSPSFAENTIGGWNRHENTDDTWKTGNLPFLYEWNSKTNQLSPVAAGGYTFKPLTGYMVQYSGSSIEWTNVVTPSVSAPKRQNSAATDLTYKLQLVRGEEEVDHTFVRFSDDENITAAFEFNQDLCKEYKSGGNIYTITSDAIQVAGNSLPLSTTQTTVVPVGVKIKTAGDYTFAIPEGTEGIGVTLVDNETGVRTLLSALDYTVDLTAGTHDQRFVLEISPIQNTPTDIENVQGDNVQCTKVRKVMIDGILYIVKDGKIFDARGARVE